VAQITRFRGDTSPDEVTITDSDGNPRDLTGHTLWLTVNTERDPSNIDNQLLQIQGAIQSPATGGVVRFTPTPAQADQVPGVYFYDIEQVDPGGFVKTLIKDVYIFEQDITKVN